MTHGAPAREAAAEPSSPGVPEPLLIELLTVAQRRLARGLSAVLDEEGCTLDQWRVMRALADGEGRAMGELAQVLLIPQASLSRVVDALADAGWVYRRQSDQDRRRITAHLSRSGRSRLVRLDALAAAHDAAVREASGTTDPGRIIQHLTAG
ncbi:MarR family winged helix-turn-helix transcriptional regulator [Kitasatospora sp. NPDC059327]|uniref:MarR family winged helix-turn-helix transcriptional regulator n=1 Tax=Kitasatospora sp. NPDC059327 TaxID=3346803 RepID=UPI003694BFE5